MGDTESTNAGYLPHLRGSPNADTPHPRPGPPMQSRGPWTKGPSILPPLPKGAAEGRLASRIDPPRRAKGSRQRGQAPAIPHWPAMRAEGEQGLIEKLVTLLDLHVSSLPRGRGARSQRHADLSRACHPRTGAKEHRAAAYELQLLFAVCLRIPRCCSAASADGPHGRVGDHHLHRVKEAADLRAQGPCRFASSAALPLRPSYRRTSRPPP